MSVYFRRRTPAKVQPSATLRVEGLEERVNPAPSVVSINRLTPTAMNTNAEFVDYQVVFSENVTGVDATDFVVRSGPPQVAAPTIAFDPTPAVTSVTPTAGPAQTYTVRVNPGVGDGEIRLDLIDNNSIKNTAATPEELVAPGGADGQAVRMARSTGSTT